MVVLNDLRRWARRDRQANRNLLKALRRPAQKHILAQRPDLSRRISIKAEALGNAHNSSARNKFRFELAKPLFEMLGATAPGFASKVPVYLLTIIDRDMVAYPDIAKPNAEPNGPALQDMREHYLSLLKGQNFIGMIEPGFYVSTEKALQVPSMISYHSHALMWDIEPEDLDEFCRGIRTKISSPIPYVTSAHNRKIKPRDLRQMLWYVTKWPREQTQVWKRASTGRFSQDSRPLSGRNAVRLYQEMCDVTLPDLAIDGGTGSEIMKRAIANSGYGRLEGRVHAEKMGKKPVGKFDDDNYYAL